MANKKKAPCQHCCEHKSLKFTEASGQVICNNCSKTWVEFSVPMRATTWATGTEVRPFLTQQTPCNVHDINTTQYRMTCEC